MKREPIYDAPTDREKDRIEMLQRLLIAAVFDHDQRAEDNAKRQSFTEHAMESVETVARETAKWRQLGPRKDCPFCGKWVHMIRSEHLGVTLEKCTRCGCEGFCT